ncbi:hypothetical protein MHBO_003218 [Bonamia ostreae]|uniref:Endonuclease/exonuclease/phosphatase domain-containing protein n=1 Tax=Bonamia ostreae TaxID=126728 RepID=A0ABV2APT0_9EUKA
MFFDVFTTHLQSDENLTDIKMSQLNQLREFIVSKNNGIDPIIITGDFNINALDSVGDIYKKFVNTLFKDLHHFDTILKNRNRHIVTGGYGTGNLKLKDVAEKSYLIDGKALDYIFIATKNQNIDSAQLEKMVKSSKVEPFVVDANTFSHVSDHYGVHSTILFDRENIEITTYKNCI